MDAYTEAHLVAAAIRLLHHQKGAQPTVEEICKLLSISTEKGLATGRKLAQKGILELLEDPFSIRLALADHLKIEELPRTEAEEDTLSQDLAAFLAKKQQESKKIETIQAELDRKKQSMFNSIEEKLKKELGNNET